MVAGDNLSPCLLTIIVKYLESVMEQFELKIKEQAACYVRMVSDAWEPV